MGTRSGAKLKLRNAPYKCDMCGRRLMSAEALKSHLDCVHNVTAKVKTKTAPLKQAVTKPKNQTHKTKNVKLDKIAVSKTKSAQPKKVSSTTKPAAKTLDKNAAKATLKSNPVDVANVEYECPECMKIFPFYFSAHRHIQKSHCINIAGEKVSPNSKHIIKPLMKELCSKCNKRLSAEPHFCTNIKVELADFGPTMNYVCSGCKQQFISLRLFDLHVAGLHCDGVESMFFPTIDEFHIWKDDMEQQTKVTFAILGKYNSKKMYRCTFMPDGGNTYDDNTSFFCPCTIVVQEYSKGIQVHFYKDHHGHICENYILADKYKKYSLTTLLQNAEGYTQIDELKVDENDLYLQFKKLMECIVLDAAKINIETLKVLIGKALDMTSVLNNYEEDPDSDSMPGKRVIEDKITWVLGELENKESGKRKLGLQVKSKIEPITKRFKTRMYQDNINNEPAAAETAPMSMLQDTTIKIINSFSLAQPEISQVINELDSENEMDSQPKLNDFLEREGTKLSTVVKDKVMIDDLAKELLKVKEKKLDQALSSFNDSYKDFVVKNFKVDPSLSPDETDESNGPNNINQPTIHTPNATKETKSIEKSIKSENLSMPMFTNKTRTSEPNLGISKNQVSTKTKPSESDLSLPKTQVPLKPTPSETDLNSHKTQMPSKVTLLDTSLNSPKPSVQRKIRHSQTGLNLPKIPVHSKARHSEAGLKFPKPPVHNKARHSEASLNLLKPLVQSKTKHSEAGLYLSKPSLQSKTKNSNTGVKLSKTLIPGKNRFSETGIKSLKSPIPTKSRYSDTGVKLSKTFMPNKTRPDIGVKLSKTSLASKTRPTDPGVKLFETMIPNKTRPFETSVKLPKTSVPSKTKPFSALNLTKPVEFKYEVKERENDCNILILKI